MRSFLFALGLFTCSGALSVFAADDELAVWLKKLETGAPRDKTTAVRMIGEIGPLAEKAIPALGKAIQTDDPGLRDEVAIALGRINSDPDRTVPILAKLLADPAPIVRHSAIEALVGFGPVAKPALDPLKAHLKDKELWIRVSAARAIAQIDYGNDANHELVIPELIAGLKSEQQQISMEAIQGLAFIGKAAVPQLKETLRLQSPQAKQNASDALGAIGPDALPALDELITVSKSADLMTEGHAITAIGHMGPAAVPATPRLIELLNSGDENIRYSAEQALQQIGKLAVPELIIALKDARRRQAAVQVLSGIGPDAAEAVPSLVPLLKDPDAGFQREVVLALATIGPAAETAGPLLVKLFENTDFKYRPAVAFALARLNVKEGIPALKEAFKTSADTVLQMASIWALLHLEPKNDDYKDLALPFLIIALDDNNPRIRREAANTLGSLGSKASSAVDGLQKHLADKEASVRKEALITLAKIGPDGAGAVPGIQQMLGDEDPAICCIASYALGRMGEPAKAAIPQLKKLAMAHHPHERLVAAWALSILSPDPETAKMITPILIEGLQRGTTTEQRVEAATALGKVGSGSEEAKHALTEASKDADPAVQEAAKASLKLLK